jgi:hypothetical protein
MGISPPPGRMDSQKKSWFQTCAEGENIFWYYILHGL